MDHENKLGGSFRRARGYLVLGSLVSAAGLLVWAGCSSSSSGGGSTNAVDPGGTYGAEISIKVVGRGSVSSKVPGISCPGDCFARYAFKSAQDVGATTGITLTAKVTSDKVRFVGWTVETVPLATRGRGPDNCNPVTRDTAAPAIDTNAADVVLPFGTVQGKVPAGQEGACSGFTDVPTAYSLTATFEDIPIPDAGVDADDGGGPDLFYDRPVYNGNVVGDAVGKEIGIPTGSSSSLYWRWQNALGKSGISRGTTSFASTPTVVVAPTLGMTLFNVDYHVTYITDDGVLHVIAAGGNLPTDIGTPPATCVALTSDSSYVYCRTVSSGSNGQLLRWSTAGGSPTVLTTNLPTGTDLWVDPSSGFIYWTDTAGGGAAAGQIAYSSLTTIDAGTPLTLASSQTNPTFLKGNNYRMFWLQPQVGGAQGNTTSSKTGSQTANQAFPPTAGINRLATSYSDSTYFWVASQTEIDRAYYSGALSLSPLRTDVNQVGGLAVDSSYVYWTTKDGRVFRKFRN